MAPAKKRRSLEGVLNESKAKAWYDQEAAKSSVSITKQQRRKSGLAKLGGFLKKYTSSSKMEKLHHSSDRVSLRSSDHSTSMSEHSHISEDSLTQRAKQNLPLRRLVEQGKIIPMESDEPMLTDTSKESLMQLGSEPGSFGSGDYTPLRELNESAISLPSTPSGKQTTVVQRSHSALSSMLSEPPPSPSSWFRRKSLRLRQRQMGSDVLKEEPELEAAESESMSGSSGLGSSEAVTPVAASTSIVAAVVTEDRRQRGLRRLPMVEPSAIPLVSEDEMTPVSALQHHDMTTLRSLSKRTPSSTSSTTLSRLGAFLLHRGPSSASRASQNTSMITPAGAIQRRKSKKETNSRRRSDTSTCSTTGSILEVSLTPRGINETLTRRCVPAEAEYNFQQVVRVLPTRAVDELSSQSYDAIAIDVFVNGDPASSFSRHVLHHVDVGSSLRDDILMEPNFRVGVRNVGSDKVTFTKKLLFVVVKRTGSEEEARRQLRFGYDAVLQKAFREESIRSLLLPQLFANALQGEGEGSVPESLTDSTLRTVYLDVVKNMNWKKISSIALAGLTAENTALLQRSFENILEEKKSLVGRSSSFK